MASQRATVQGGRCIGLVTGVRRRDSQHPGGGQKRETAGSSVGTTDGISGCLAGVQALVDRAFGGL